LRAPRRRFIFESDRIAAAQGICFEEARNGSGTM
jgi:hypothetical protein